MTQISFEEAKRLSLIKFRLIIDNEGKLPDEFPDELKYLKNYCGFCERWNVYNQKRGKEMCCGCEFAKVQGRSCLSFYSLYQQFNTASNCYPDQVVEVVELAQKIYDLLNSMKEDNQSSIV